MSDSDPHLSPEQEAAVRRLLADARATEPMPAEVAARLDGVLADLGDEPQGEAPAGSSPEVRRRRRRAASLVLAAATVVIVGVGVGQLLRGGGGADDAATGAEATTMNSRQISPTMESAEEEGDNTALDRAESDELELGAAPPREATVGRVTRKEFAADARTVRRAIPPGAARAAGGFAELNPGSLPRRNLSPRSGLACGAAPWGPGVLVPVMFDGQPAVLAFRPPTGDSQVVHVLQCGSGQPLHSTTLPRRRG